MRTLEEERATLPRGPTSAWAAGVTAACLAGMISAAAPLEARAELGRLRMKELCLELRCARPDGPPARAEAPPSPLVSVLAPAPAVPSPNHRYQSMAPVEPLTPWKLHSLKVSPLSDRPPVLPLLRFGAGSD